MKAHKTHHIGFRLTEVEHTKLAAIAEEQGSNPGEWCRAIALEATRKKGERVRFFEHVVLEELAALRGIVSSVLYDLATESKLTSERMNQIIAHADQSKFERATHIINELLKRQSQERT